MECPPVAYNRAMPRQPNADGSLSRALGRTIGDARRSRGMTQSDLAMVTGCSVKSVAKYEQGSRSPSYEQFIRIARACDIPPSALFSRLDEYPLPPAPCELDDDDEEDLPPVRRRRT